MAQKTTKTKSRWHDRLSRTGYFLGALLFHLVLFLMVATWIVYRIPPQEKPNTVTNYYPPSAPKPPPAPPVLPPTYSNSNASLPIPTPIIHSDGGPAIFPPKMPTLGDPRMTDNHLPKPRSPVAIHADNLDVRLPEIMNTVTNYWHHDPRSDDPSATFPVFVASYANGDWACNTQLDKDGNIVAGSIPDLMAKINEWSHGSIKGEVVPKPLNIGGPELMAKRPPFIFFTGHKDFVLTDQEIQNLRDYLQVGGAIWGDNALAGEGSRFDVAFKREMKRVLPDKDKNFEPYTLSDDIFTKGAHPITRIPPGMNYYAEPPEHIDINGILAILYTPNDYSDLMFMRVLPGDKEVYVPNDPPPNTLFTDRDFWSHRDVFYRNFDLSSTLAVQHLGMNIISYLIVRFDDKLLLTP